MQVRREAVGLLAAQGLEVQARKDREWGGRDQELVTGRLAPSRTGPRWKNSVGLQVVSRSFYRWSTVRGQMVDEELHGTLSIASSDYLSRCIKDLILSFLCRNGTGTIT
jgi:hypothetical protein